MQDETPILALTPGEPAGVGPECAVRLAQQHPEFRLLHVADPQLLEATAASLQIDLEVRSWQPGMDWAPGVIHCFPIRLAATVLPGKPDTANAPYVLDCIRTATGLVQKKIASALVTGPVHKGVINDAGLPFTGHTEFLAQIAEVPRVVMMLAADRLRVALVTTHLPLGQVPPAITPESVGETIRITHEALRGPFGIAEPRIQVLGLNPHAGEGGHLGHEDIQAIEPAIAAGRALGYALTGPVPADAAFTPAALARCDAVIAMYHDQGLPVLKHAGFGKAVNITLGLPFIRTSVDHGTALDIAGHHRADAGSLRHAVEMALDLCRAGGDQEIPDGTSGP